MRPVRVCSGVAKTIQALCASLILLFSCVSAFSQGGAGRILGTISDQTGGAISGATVTIIDVQRGTSRTLTTEDSGSYNAPNLLPGTYRVRAEFKGFRVTERQNIILEVSQELRVDLTLQPGEQTQTITVTEQLPLVETTNAELGGTIQNQAINDLPLNGRNFENLLELRPGVAIYPGGSGWTQSTNGMRAHDNVYMVDGVNSSDPWMAQSVMNAVMASGDAGTLISIDAIDEFKTQQNPRAEYGWKPGAVVNVGIKSGTNTIHGTAFAFGRETALDAHNVFDLPGSPKTPVALEQFGGSFGGPLKKDKLFYFANFESQRYEVGSTQLVTDPITAAGVGTATSNLQLACAAALAPGGGGVAPLSAQLAGLNPSTCAPNSNYPGLFPTVDGSNGTKYSAGLTSTNKIYSGLAKVDYHINDKNSLSGMYFISPGSGILNDSPASQTNAVWLTNQYARSQAFSASWTWTPNSTWVNEARVGYSHYYQVFQSQDSTQNPANYSFKGATYNVYTGQTNPLYYGLPGITIQGFSGALGAGWPKTVGPDGVLQVLDHVSYLHGKHSFKFGGEILSNRSTSNVTANTKGPIRFGPSSSGLKNFFNGVPNRAVTLTGNLVRHISAGGYAAFIQDDWRVTQRLTLNLGLRYEIDGVEKERDDLFANFDTTRGLVQVGSGISSPYHGDHNNFSPRVGLAWDMFGNGKTVFRAGAGVLYEQLSFDVFNGIGNSFGLRTNPTGAALYANGIQVPSPGSIGVTNISFTGSALNSKTTPGAIAYDWINNSPSTTLYNFSAACGDGTVTLANGFKPQQCSALMVDPNLRTPYVTDFSVDIQRAITNDVSIDIGYVGNHGTKLVGALDINQPQLVGGFSPGWGNPAVAGTPAGNCLASAPAYNNCAPSNAAEQAARPFNAKFPYLKFIEEMGNIDSSNYNSLQATLTVRNYHGLSLNAGYTYSHALGYASDQGTGGGLVLPLNSYGDLHSQLYTSTSFDTRHRLTLTGTYNIPGVKGFGQALQGWSINATARIFTGSPWGVGDVTTDFAGTGAALVSGTFGSEGGQWNFMGASGGAGNPHDFFALHNFANVTPPTPGAVAGVPGVPYYAGTTNPNCLAQAKALDGGAATGLAQASLTNLGCYALGNSILLPPAYGGYGSMPRNPFRDQGFRTMDLSITKVFKFKERLTTQFRAEFFNVLNHPNFVNPYGGPGGNAASLDPSGAGTPSAGFGFVYATPDQAGSNPVLGSGGARSIQLGLKLIF
ncbi:MAG: TonB-dependent receptor [Acidobacteriia bacterium]|nr:TonB-dependent receptor [Terriglobia bacterium]